jgi:hypothetical protein
MLRQFASSGRFIICWCLSHNILFSSEFDDYSIAEANGLLVAISLFYVFRINAKLT